MNKNEIEAIIKNYMELSDDELDIPDEEDWKRVERKFGSSFGGSYRNFIELMTKYEFPGEIYNVSRGKTSGDDPLISVYDYEVKTDVWDKDMVPFYGLGNGDYFCFSKKGGRQSKVYFVDHSSNQAAIKFDTFEEWIKNLPVYLSWNKLD